MAWVCKTIPSELSKASTLLGPGTAASMTSAKCTMYIHHSLVQLMVSMSKPDVGRAGHVRPGFSRVLVSPATVPVPSRPVPDFSNDRLRVYSDRASRRASNDLCAYMRLVASVCVCVYVTKKLTCLVPYCSKNSCYVYYTTWSWNLNASKVVFYVQRVVQTEHFVRVIFKAGPGILHYGMPHLKSYAIMHLLLLHVQQSSESAFCAHRVCVLWNSSL